nr:hypothetical protein B0A51_05345 [Rachicladosporium sp. CCFEE 5018]
MESGLLQAFARLTLADAHASPPSTAKLEHHQLATSAGISTYRKQQGSSNLLDGRNLRLGDEASEYAELPQKQPRLVLHPERLDPRGSQMRTSRVTTIPRQQADAGSVKVAASLLTLPTELRLIIYDMVFADALGEEVLSKNDCYPLPPLMRITSQTRIEALKTWEDRLASAGAAHTVVIIMSDIEWKELCSKATGGRWFNREEESRLGELTKSRRKDRQRFEDLAVLRAIASTCGHERLGSFQARGTMMAQQSLSIAKATSPNTSESEHLPSRSRSVTPLITSEKPECQRSSCISFDAGQKSSTSPGERPISFMDLPAELRLIIYDMVFGMALQPAVLVRRRCYPLPPVLRTSRLLRSEALAQWEASLDSAQTIQTNITADAFARWLKAESSVRNLGLSAEERQLCMKEIREKHKDTQQRLEDLKALVFFAGWMGKALFYWPRAFPGPYDEDKDLDMLMTFGVSQDRLDE